MRSRLRRRQTGRETGRRPLARLEPEYIWTDKCAQVLRQPDRNAGTLKRGRPPSGFLAAILVCPFNRVASHTRGRGEHVVPRSARGELPSRSLGRRELPTPSGSITRRVQAAAAPRGSAPGLCSQGSEAGRVCLAMAPDVWPLAGAAWDHWQANCTQRSRD